MNTSTVLKQSLGAIRVSPTSFTSYVREADRLADEEMARGEWLPVETVYPVFLPGAWRTEIRDELRAAYRHRDSGIIAAISTARERDGRRWVHVSVSHPKRIPHYGELTQVKELLIGRDRMAYQIFAPSSEHVNFHSNCLHLFSCLDGEGPGGSVLPDFRKGGSI